VYLLTERKKKQIYKQGLIQSALLKAKLFQKLNLHQKILSAYSS